MTWLLGTITIIKYISVCILYNNMKYKAKMMTLNMLVVIYSDNVIIILNANSQVPVNRGYMCVNFMSSNAMNFFQY